MIHLDLERILAYVGERMEPDELLNVEEHLSLCEECATRVRAQFFIRVHFDELFDGWTARSDAESSRKELAGDPAALRRAAEKERALKLTESLGRAISKSPASIRAKLQQIFLDLQRLFLLTFTFPAPAFSPVFGKGEAHVLSPFGKIRPPVVFAWEPIEGMDHYILTLEETGWSRSTLETEIIAGQDELGIEYGEEYMWDLKAMRQQEVLQEVSGFFTLAPREQIQEIVLIERQLEETGGAFERLANLGAILERMEFYQEAAVKYQEAFKLDPAAGIAYRIASCYDRLELEELRDRWNEEVLRLNHLG